VLSIKNIPKSIHRTAAIYLKKETFITTKITYYGLIKTKTRYLCKFKLLTIYKIEMSK